MHYILFVCLPGKILLLGLHQKLTLILQDLIVLYSLGNSLLRTTQQKYLFPPLTLFKGLDCVFKQIWLHFEEIKRAFRGEEDENRIYDRA